MKWQRIRSFYYLGLAFYFLFMVLLTTLIILDYGECSLQTGGVDTCRDEQDTKGLKVIVGIFISGLFLLEVVQLAVSFKRYIASPENILKVGILIISTILVLDKSLDWQFKRHLAALVIVLSWMEFLICLGPHPSLNTMAFMFYSVVSTFF